MLDLFSLVVRSYDRMLSTNGNTAVYLQFAHARLASILRKAEEEKYADLDEVKSAPEMVSVEHQSERALAFELLVFSDVVEVRPFFAPTPCYGVLLDLCHRVRITWWDGM